MRRSVFLLCLVALGQAACPAARSGNLFTFRLNDGWGEVEWISGSSFRWTRVWGRGPARRPPTKGERVKVTRKDLGDRWQFRTSYLVVEVAKKDLKFRVTDDEGKALAQTLAMRRAPQAVELEFLADGTEQFYGLGMRTAASLNLRGQAIRAGKPFLISSLGYGEYYRGAGEYVFDLGQSQADRRTVKVPDGREVEYYFYYGPSPKEILEEHVALGAPGSDLDSEDFRILEAASVPGLVARLPEGKGASWSGLRESIYALMHAGFSAMLASAFDLGPYLRADQELRERAAQLATVAPVVWTSRAAALRNSSTFLKRTVDLRKRLTPFLVVYAQEARERGFPIVRPLAMQYHSDSETWKWTDEFLLGDELLVAPVCEPGGRRSVYFPRGVWTDLRSNRVYKSRETVEIQAAPDELPVFGRNGSIVPLAPLAESDPMELHYFPKLAAEFFVLEEDLSDYTLLHAAPAVEVVRLEIESLKDRDYEWVVHHTGPCRRVAQVDGPEYREAKSLAELKPGWWFYDRATDNLHVRVHARAGQDHVVNLWLEVVWN